MPELPEAETIARAVQRELADRTLGRITLYRRDVARGSGPTLERMLPQRRVTRVFRRAKRVVLELDPPARVVFRLGMTGRLLITTRQTPPEPHTHFRAEIKGTENELRFSDPRRFGGIRFSSGSHLESDDELAHLGQEPLSIRPAQFIRLLCRHRQIKALLMDQTAIAGLGNIYCDESLHAAGIHPLTRADQLDAEDAARLLHAIKSILRKAIRFSGSTYMDYRRPDGQSGLFQQYHQVYQRAGEPCRTCGAIVRRILAAGRSSFFCPDCQIRSRRSQRRNAKTSKLTGKRATLA